MSDKTKTWIRLSNPQTEWMRFYPVYETIKAHHDRKTQTIHLNKTKIKPLCIVLYWWRITIFTTEQWPKCNKQKLEVVLFNRKKRRPFPSLFHFFKNWNISWMHIEKRNPKWKTRVIILFSVLESQNNTLVFQK